MAAVVDIVRARALTVHQPWAELIAAGVKRVENRTWRTRHRGPLLIHASGRVEGVGEAWASLPAFVQIRMRRPFALGAIVGRVNVVDCLSRRDYVERFGPDPFASGPWCWVLADAERFDEPARCRGRQALWTYEGPLPEPTPRRLTG